MLSLAPQKAKPQWVFSAQADRNRRLSSRLAVIRMTDIIMCVAKRWTKCDCCTQLIGMTKQSNSFEEPFDSSLKVKRGGATWLGKVY